jgi:hypothetical protein
MAERSVLTMVVASAPVMAAASLSLFGWPPRLY